MAKRRANDGPGHSASHRSKRSGRCPCYLHAVRDPNEHPYDPKRHSICMVCAVKLWELARAGLNFDMRDSQVTLSLTPTPGNRVVTLSTGYEVSLDDDDGLVHLFNAIFGETLARLQETPELRERGFELVHDFCLFEIHFVAGQLFSRGSSLDVGFLIDQFGAQWDRLADQLNKDRDAQGDTGPD